MLMLLLIFCVKLSFGLTTARIRLTDESLEYLPGYSRNYTPASLGWGRRLVKGNIDEWAPVTFCDTSQQNQFQNKFWPRLRAFPGANISVDYTLSPGVSSERAGHITLFGSNNAGFPDTRNFQSFLPLDSTITELVNIPYEDAISTRRTTFQIATNAGSSSRYTMYWMWNTTVSISDAWVIYTSCYDIDIMAFSAKSTSESVTATETATSNGINSKTSSRTFPSSATSNQAVISPKEPLSCTTPLSGSSSKSHSKPAKSESMTTPVSIGSQTPATKTSTHVPEDRSVSCATIMQTRCITLTYPMKSSTSTIMSSTRSPISYNTTITSVVWVTSH